MVTGTSGTSEIGTTFLDRKVVRSFLKLIGKGFFTVTFEKKDGTLRTMNCRKGVKKHLKGGDSTIAHKRDLVSVYDVKSRGYRCFDVTRVTDIKANNAALTANQPKAPTPPSPKPASPGVPGVPGVIVVPGQEWAPRRNGGSVRVVVNVGSDAGGNYVLLKSQYKTSRIALSRFYKDYSCVSFTADPTPVATTTVTPPILRNRIAPILRNRIALVLDESGSMGHLSSKVSTMFNEMVKTLITEHSNDPNDQTELTLVTFGTAGPNPVVTKLKNMPVADAQKSLTTICYSPYGNTPLWDGVAQAIAEIDDGKAHPDTSFVVMVLTDGEENASYKTSDSQFSELLARKQATDKWTFTFLLPPSNVSAFKAKNVVPEGNIQGWADMKVAEVATNAGLRSFYNSRRRLGASSVKNFFTTDLSKITSSDVSKLLDITFQVRVWTVEKEMGIRPFVESHSAGGSPILFVKGQGYYELTKPETVQDYKKILLMKKVGPDMGRVYGEDGVREDGVRSLLGLPTSGDAKVTPGNHGEYTLLIQSTSPNRVLCRGTKFVYYK